MTFLNDYTLLNMHGFLSLRLDRHNISCCDTAHFMTSVVIPLLYPIFNQNLCMNQRLTIHPVRHQTHILPLRKTHLWSPRHGTHLS